MSDTHKPPKCQKLSDIYKRAAPTRGFENLGNGDSESRSPEDDSDEFYLKAHRRKSKVKKRVAPKRSGAKRKMPLPKGSDNKRSKFESKCNLGKRGRKSSSSARCEASTSATKKGYLSRGSKKVTEMGGHTIQITNKSIGSVSALGVKKVQLPQPAMTLSKLILTSSNDEIGSVLGLLSLSNEPPATGLTSSNDEIVSVLGLLSLSNEPPAPGFGLPQSEPIEPETFVCITNRNPSEFSTDIARNYMRSC